MQKLKQKLEILQVKYFGKTCIGIFNNYYEVRQLFHKNGVLK